MNARLREARRDDIEAMHRIRLSVRENRLISTAINEEDYVAAIEETGRGWVVELDARIVGFAIGNARTGSIWALFVDPNHEKRGYGRKLHDTMIGWLWSQGLDRLWLTTEPRTRAQRFYEVAGWAYAGSTDGGEHRYELRRSAADATAAQR
ncbi:MAG TPA: GNAT family N-acetyltransferase [Gammaproteobacteria bacterium]|jgi:GNAT superfamily N-acetyltransferase